MFHTTAIGPIVPCEFNPEACWDSDHFRHRLARWTRCDGTCRRRPLHSAPSLVHEEAEVGPNGALGQAHPAR